MLRKDFMLKQIEQFAKMVARLTGADIENEPGVFGKDFDQLIKDFFKLENEDLEKLLLSHPDRDELLLDERSKNSQLLLFSKAGTVFAKKGETEKAESCLKIIERIKDHHSSVFEFPNEESQKIEAGINQLTEILKK